MSSNHHRHFPNKTQQQRFIPKTTSSSSQTPKPNSTQSFSSSGVISSSSSSGSFVNYLPQDEAVAAGLGAEDGGLDAVESQKVVDLLNRECGRLLKLNPKDFWTQVASDTSLHAFLESFLKYRSRWYDFPYRGAKGIVAGVIVGEHELNRRVFMILYRISSNRDPGAKASDSLSAKDHAVILQEKKLLDLPKLLDICAIYGHENEELTRLIVTNAIKAQPLIHDSFTAAISHFLNIVHTMYERCTTSLEVLSSSHEAQHSSTRLHTDYLEVMDFINDAVVPMDALVTAYNYAAVYFSCPVETSYGSDELIKILARLHDSLLPALQQGFRIIFPAQKDKLAEVIISLKMLASRIVKLCWKLLNFSYLSDEVFKEATYFSFVSKIFPAQVEDPVIRSDILVQAFREISEECSTVAHDGRNKMSLLQNIEKSYQIMSRLEALGNQGWISMDNEQLRYLSGIVSVSNGTDVIHLPSNKVVEMNEDNAIMESKISQVKDLFPDYGNGFISACLEVYDHNPEEVIQRILEGTLDKDLLSLDTSIAVAPKPKAAAPPPVGKKDKGKGKLVEPEREREYMPKPQVEGPSSTSSSSVGRFIRKSSTNVPDSQILNSKDESSKSFALKSLLEYEDEYDDSFDDLGLGVRDSGHDDLNEKVSSTEASEASRWGSRQKPQFYVKDGKNYSYKVSGSVAAANINEASIVNQAQKELIHGLGRGGNFPLGAAQKIMEVNERKQNGEQNVDKKDVNAPVRSNKGQYDEQGVRSNKGQYDEQGVRSNKGQYDEQGVRSNKGQYVEQGVRLNKGQYDEQAGRGRGRGWGRGNIGKQQNVSESNGEEDGNESVSIGERGRGGRGRGGRRGGGRSNNYRKDQAMKKHFSGLGGI